MAEQAKYTRILKHAALGTASMTLFALAACTPSNESEPKKSDHVAADGERTTGPGDTAKSARSNNLNRMATDMVNRTCTYVLQHPSPSSELPDEPLLFKGEDASKITNHGKTVVSIVKAYEDGPAKCEALGVMEFPSAKSMKAYEKSKASFLSLPKDVAYLSFQSIGESPAHPDWYIDARNTEHFSSQLPLVANMPNCDNCLDIDLAKPSAALVAEIGQLFTKELTK